jgi:hypothetical protein
LFVSIASHTNAHDFLSISIYLYLSFWNSYSSPASGRAQSMAAPPEVDLLGGFDDVGSGSLVPAVNPNAAYPGAPPQQQPSAYYPPTSQPAMHQAPQQQPGYPPQSQPPATYGAPAPPQGYPQYPQAQAPMAQQQQQQPDYGGYPQQSQQQAGYPAPQPVQQF